MLLNQIRKELDTISDYICETFIYIYLSFPYEHLILTKKYLISKINRIKNSCVKTLCF